MSKYNFPAEAREIYFIYEDLYVYGFANVSQHIHNPLSFCFPANVELSHIKSDILHKQLVFPTQLVQIVGKYSSSTQGGRSCAKGLCQVWTRTKILSPNIGFFVVIIIFVAIYALFGIVWTKQMLFWVKTVLFRSALLHGLYCMLY